MDWELPAWAGAPAEERPATSPSGTSSPLKRTFEEFDESQSEKSDAVSTASQSKLSPTGSGPSQQGSLRQALLSATPDAERLAKRRSISRAGSQVSDGTSTVYQAKLSPTDSAPPQPGSLRHALLSATPGAEHLTQIRSVSRARSQSSQPISVMYRSTPTMSLNQALMDANPGAVQRNSSISRPASLEARTQFYSPAPSSSLSQAPMKSVEVKDEEAESTPEMAPPTWDSVALPTRILTTLSDTRRDTSQHSQTHSVLADDQPRDDSASAALQYSEEPRGTRARSTTSHGPEIQKPDSLNSIPDQPSAEDRERARHLKEQQVEDHKRAKEEARERAKAEKERQREEQKRAKKEARERAVEEKQQRLENRIRAKEEAREAKLAQKRRETERRARSRSARAQPRRRTRSSTRQDAEEEEEEEEVFERSEDLARNQEPTDATDNNDDDDGDDADDIDVEQLPIQDDSSDEDFSANPRLRSKASASTGRRQAQNARARISSQRQTESDGEQTLTPEDKARMQGEEEQARQLAAEEAARRKAKRIEARRVANELARPQAQANARRHDEAYSNAFRNLLNESIHELAHPFYSYYTTEESELDDSYIGRTLWKAADKEIFFEATARFGHDIKRIAAEVGKSVLEVSAYIDLLEQGMKEQKHYLDPEIDAAELAIAMEFPSTSEEILEAAADGLAWEQFKLDMEKEMKHYGQKWLIAEDDDDDDFEVKAAALYYDDLEPESEVRDEEASESESSKSDYEDPDEYRSSSDDDGELREARQQRAQISQETPKTTDCEGHESQVLDVEKYRDSLTPACFPCWKLKRDCTMEYPMCQNCKGAKRRRLKTEACTYDPKLPTRQGKVANEATAVDGLANSGMEDGGHQEQIAVPDLAPVERMHEPNVAANGEGTGVAGGEVLIPGSSVPEEQTEDNTGSTGPVNTFASSLVPDTQHTAATPAPPAPIPAPGHQQPAPRKRLLRTRALLHLSKHLFLNSSSPSSSYQTYTHHFPIPRTISGQPTGVESQLNSPALFRGAYDLLTEIVRDLTRRMVKCIIGITCSRMRREDNTRHPAKPFPIVEEGDVFLAREVLGIKGSVHEYWAGFLGRHDVGWGFEVRDESMEDGWRSVGVEGAMVRGWVGEGGRDLRVLFRALEARDAAARMQAGSGIEGEAMDVEVDERDVEGDESEVQDIEKEMREARALDKYDRAKSREQVRQLLRRIGKSDEALLSGHEDETEDEDETELEDEDAFTSARVEEPLHRDEEMPQLYGDEIEDKDEVDDAAASDAEDDNIPQPPSSPSSGSSTERLGLGPVSADKQAIQPQNPRFASSSSSSSSSDESTPTTAWNARQPPAPPPLEPLPPPKQSAPPPSAAKPIPITAKTNGSSGDSDSDGTSSSSSDSDDESSEDEEADRRVRRIMAERVGNTAVVRQRTRTVSESEGSSSDEEDEDEIEEHKRDKMDVDN